MMTRAKLLPAEVRAMWVVRNNLTSPGAVKRVVDLAGRYGFNALFVQVRGRGDAYYCSSFEPRAESLLAQPADFDPLGYLLERVRPYGIQVHAWLNVFYIWSDPRRPRSPEHLLNKHPEWIAQDVRGHWQMTGANGVEGAYLCPTNPHVQAHLLRVYTEVAQRYDGGGIHFDYVRYPNPDYCYCDGCLSRFRAWMKPRLTTSQVKRLQARLVRDRLAYQKAFSAEWEQWRREQVSSLVQQISTAVCRIKPTLLVSAAVYPDPTKARRRKMQDWLSWLHLGYLDVALPMAYHPDTAVVQRQIQNAVRASKGYPVVAGIGAWRIAPESTLNKIRAARNGGARGFCLFSYGGITNDGQSESYLAQLERALNV